MNIKTLSSEEIIEKYDITASQMDFWSCGKKPFVPVHGNKFNAKWRRTVKVYAAHDVEAFFKKAGIRRRNPRKPIVSLTDASVILGVTYSMAKKLVNVDDRFRKLVIDITKKTYSFKRSDVLWYKKNILDKDGLPKPQQKAYKKPSECDFNKMAMAFICAPSEIRPRMTTCGDIISSIRTEGEWGINL
jgi:hypothetical protein